MIPQTTPAQYGQAELMVGLTTDVPPKSVPLQVDASGVLQTAATFSGTITVGAVSIQDHTTPANYAKVDASGNLSVLINAIPAGTAIIGKVGIDQTTPGTTNAVQIISTLPAFASTPTVNIGSDVVASFIREAGAAPTGTPGNLGGHAATKGVFVKADDDNTNSIFVGESTSITADVGVATSGLRLKAGQSAFLPVNNGSLVYLLASVASQNYVALII